MSLPRRGALRKVVATVRHLPASVLFCSLVFALSACGPRVTDQNIDALNRQFAKASSAGKSLTIKEVESILGQPTRQESFPIERQTTKELPLVRYYYQQGDQTAVVQFMDNRLIQSVGHFGDAGAELSDRDPDHLVRPASTSQPPAK